MIAAGTQDHDTINYVTVCYRTTVLEYAVEAGRIRPEDRIMQYAGQNYSVTGLVTAVNDDDGFIIIIYNQELR